MKRLFSSAALLFLIVPLFLFACASGEYKRINIGGKALGEDGDHIGSGTTVNNKAKESFAQTMPFYKCVPREITDEQLEKYANKFGIIGEISPLQDGKIILQGADAVNNKGSRSISARNNELSCSMYSRAVRGDYSWTDEKLEEEAKKVFARIDILQGDYEYLGITSTRVAHTSEGEKIDTVRVSFRRLIDGARIIGDDICDFYFDGSGLCGIEIKLYDYEKTGEFDMVPLEDAFSRVKRPDSFSITKAEDSAFSGVADKMTIERVKLLLVNQYTGGCEILQPVYNIIGTLENETGTVEFSSRVIAIPEKYTY